MRPPRCAQANALHTMLDWLLCGLDRDVCKQCMQGQMREGSNPLWEVGLRYCALAGPPVPPNCPSFRSLHQPAAYTNQLEHAAVCCSVLLHSSGQHPTTDITNFQGHELSGGRGIFICIFIGECSMHARMCAQYVCVCLCCAGMVVRNCTQWVARVYSL